MNIPCEECITLPICRIKYYPKLKSDCSIINKFLYLDCLPEERRASFILRIRKVYELMKPAHWEVTQEKDDRARVRYRSADEKGTFVIDRNMTYYKHDNQGAKYYP